MACGNLKTFKSLSTLLVLLALNLSVVPSVFSQTAQTKVVVIPMGGDEANCTWRWSPQATLSGQSGLVKASCEANEQVISGAYFVSSFNTTRDCRVLSSIPIIKDGTPQFPNDGWRTDWWGTSSNSCSGYKVSVRAFCCK